ncbi:cryptochrome/photolyase family protein [Candidatus Nanohalovita haloferacivicina]|uniref:cryptochrome/photolyase family protein n=1 Tax=Candidatus Nanohalovita haloferacivicina TaxID=2978046 RepID=UPI00325FA163|nr:Deoxyribodipyrimidine photo-lyase [Candidatus Nanohalobia archaeon BNXNv]
MTAIVWIRRSLREHDNTALVKASEEHEEVIPFYVVDDNYFSNATLGYPRVSFWHDSLKELKENLSGQQGKDLVVRKGKPIEQLQKIVEETGADAVYHNKDYTPYARERDEKVAEKLDVPVNKFKDVVMFEEKEILTNSGTSYKVYTYFSKKWFKKEKRRPQEVEDYTTPDIDSDEIPSLKELGFEKPDDMEVWEGGRENGLDRIEEFKDKIWNYDENRDYAWKDSTSKLSPHLRFGTVSIREVFWEAERIKARNPDSDTSGIKTWQEELAWRDFYMQVLYNWPETAEKPFLEQYEDIEWRSKEEAEEDWEAFINGKTGYPFVDAGMRQLKRTGWMHNRLRMVVTSFACKDLWLDWKDLHEYFKKMFVDAEKASMIGGIQWAYSIGTDAQPYFRVFNPYSQSEDYDPDGEYIKNWVPELEDVPDEHIHRPHKMNQIQQENYGIEIGEDYPRPIVNHDEKRKEAIEKFEEVRED